MRGGRVGSDDQGELLGSLDPSSAGQGGRMSLQYRFPRSIFLRYGIGRQR